MTLGEQAKRVEAAAKRRFDAEARSDEDRYQWGAVGASVRAYYRERARADLAAADEAVPVVSRAEAEARLRGLRGIASEALARHPDYGSER